MQKTKILKITTLFALLILLVILGVSMKYFRKISAWENYGYPNEQAYQYMARKSGFVGIGKVVSAESYDDIVGMSGDNPVYGRFQNIKVDIEKVIKG